MSRVRTHFCTLAARLYGAGSRPVRYGMKGTIPATVNSSDGSGETSDALGTTVCPRWAKCSRKRRRISAVCMSTRRLGGKGCPEALLGGVRAATLVAGRGQRSVEAGAGPQLQLPLGGGGPDVGAEVADGVGEVAQPVDQLGGDALRGQLLGRRGELADDEDPDGDAHGEPEEAAHQAASSPRRRARRWRRAALSRAVASAIAWPSRFFLAAVRT